MMGNWKYCHRCELIFSRPSLNGGCDCDFDRTPFYCPKCSETLRKQSLKNGSARRAGTQQKKLKEARA